MLNFVFDHNAFIRLFDRKDYAEIEATVGQYTREGFYRIWFSATNLTEMMKGITEDSFQERKDCLGKALSLAQNRFFFPSQADYVFMDVRTLGLAGLLEKGAFVRRQCEEILCMADTQTYRGKYGWVLDEVDTNDREFFRDVSYAQASVLGRSMAERKSSASERCDETRRLSFLKDSVIQLISKYAPQLAPEKGGGINLMVLLRRRPAILYISELVRAFSRKTYLNRRRVRQGDNHDFMYALYLDVCDYLVTDDRSLRSMFEETNLPELIGRAIRLDKFVDNLETPHLFPRSPIWIDGPNGR